MSLEREWTERENELADQVVQTLYRINVMEGKPGVVGLMTLAREVHLSVHESERERTIRRLQAVAPLAAAKVVISHPGWALRKEQDPYGTATYKITKVSSVRSLRTAITATKRSVTSLRHAADSIPPDTPIARLVSGQLRRYADAIVSDPTLAEISDSILRDLAEEKVEP